MTKPKTKTKQGEWEKELAKLVSDWRDDNFNLKQKVAISLIGISMDNIWRSVYHLLSQARKEARDDALSEPMGVSKWMNHGKKYGYWEHFNKEARDEAIGAVGEGANRWGIDMSKNPLESPMTENEISFANGYDVAKDEIRQRLNQLKEKNA